MTNNETIGLAIFAVVILIATWQWAFALGREVGTKRERQLADRHINSVLAQWNARKPTPRKRKRLLHRKVDPIIVGKKRYLNSRLPGRAIA